LYSHFGPGNVARRASHEACGSWSANQSIAQGATTPSGGTTTRRKLHLPRTQALQSAAVVFTRPVLQRNPVFTMRESGLVGGHLYYMMHCAKWHLQRTACLLTDHTNTLPLQPWPQSRLSKRACPRASPTPRTDHVPSTWGSRETHEQLRLPAAVIVQQ
jgi:hypothetical protein